jgi:hypothetical protein
MRSCALLIALCAAILSPARAEGPTYFIDGNTLLKWCGLSRTAIGSGNPQCIGYLEGVSDTMSISRAVNNMSACPPEGVTAGQLSDVTYKFLRKNPEKRNLPAALLVTLAFFQAWCPNESPPPIVNYNPQQTKRP